MIGDLFAMLNDKGLNISNSPISAKYFAELVQSIKTEKFQEELQKKFLKL